MEPQFKVHVHKAEAAGLSDINREYRDKNGWYVAWVEGPWLCSNPVTMPEGSVSGYTEQEAVEKALAVTQAWCDCLSRFLKGKEV